MAYEQISAILNNIRRVHRKAAECCADSVGGPDERLSLLADIFQAREEALGRRLNSSSGGDRGPVLETWIQYPATQNVDEALAALCEARKNGPNATFKSCLELQQAIVNYFRELSENQRVPSVRDLLKDVAAAEERAVKQLGMADATQNDA